MANASDKMGSNPRNSQHGAKGAGETDPEQTLDEFDLATDIEGDNALAGENQERHMNQRHAQADADGDTDELLESFKKTDKHYRAEAEHLKRQDK